MGLLGEEEGVSSREIMYEALGAIYLDRDVPDRVDGVLYRKEGTWGSPDPQGARPGEWDALPPVHRLKLSTEEKKLHYRLFWERLSVIRFLYHDARKNLPIHITETYLLSPGCGYCFKTIFKSCETLYSETFNLQQ